MNEKRRIAISIFAIAAAYGFSITGLMPVLGLISVSYAQISTSIIQLMQTLPYALIIVGALVIGVLTTRFSKKYIALAGLLIIGICGTVPFFFADFYVLFVSRLLIGFGFGITGPLNTAIISEFFEPEKRAGYMGLHVVGMGIGTVIGNMIGGILAGEGLRYFYLVYLLSFICALVVWFMLPMTPPVRNRKVSDMKLTRMVYELCAISFIFTLFISAYGVNISMYITQNLTDNTSASGLATAVNALVATCTGLLFSRIVTKLKRATLPFAVFAAGTGYFVVMFVPGMTGILIASALCGIAPSCFNAMTGYLISVSVEKDAVAKASGIFSIVGSIGGLIAPVVLSGLASVFGGNTPGNQFVAAMGGMLIFGIIISVYIGRSKPEE